MHNGPSVRKEARFVNSVNGVIFLKENRFVFSDVNGFKDGLGSL